MHCCLALNLNDSTDMVSMLLNAGADPTARDRRGYTPLDVELRINHGRHQRNIQLLQTAVAELDRPRALFKARSLLDAARAVNKIRSDARTRAGRSRAAVGAVPAFLKGRAADGRELPRPQAERGGTR